MGIQKPLVLGLGGVGTLVAALLRDAGMEVSGVDRHPPAALPDGIHFISGDVTNSAALAEWMGTHDAVISCLPYHLTLSVAEAAYTAGIHYFDPTEDVATTNAIRTMAEDAKAAMIPQNGLAPGFIGILGAHLARQFDEATKLRHIKLRVGALPQHPIGQLGYSGNWSLEGLVHEYIAECDIIANTIQQKVAALKNEEILRIDGIEYEAFTTSGGLGTMTETYAGHVETLNYKSIRYPGHLQAMKLLIEELRFREDPDALVRILQHALPPDRQDRVLIHASVQGHCDGKLQTQEIVADYKPITLHGTLYPAIQWTTAAAIVAVVSLVNEGVLSQHGFVKQESIALHDFLQTPTGALYAHHNPVLQGVSEQKT